MSRMLMLAASAILSAMPAAAQEPSYPRVLPAPGGAVIIPTPWQQSYYDDFRFAPARRVGDMLYVSGVVMARRSGEGTDTAAFEAQARRALRQVDGALRAGGSSWDEVVIINSFHIMQGPNFSGTPLEQLDILGRVRGEFTTAPHPAWTAVGVTALMAPEGIVEIQVIARVPGG